MPLVALIPQPNAPVELRDVPSPELENDSALLEVELSEVCGTDVYLQKGLLKGVPYPLVPGHVSVGWLSKIRGALFDVEGREFREGLGRGLGSGLRFAILLPASVRYSNANIH